jgi:hypothetical protein
VPDARGVKVMLKVQLPPAATVDPHVFVWAKSAAFVPVTVMLLMASAAVPVLVRVTV